MLQSQESISVILQSQESISVVLQSRETTSLMVQAKNNMGTGKQFIECSPSAENC